VKKAAGKVWGVWERAYDDAMARPVHAVKVFGIVVAVLAVVAGRSFYQAITTHVSMRHGPMR